MEVKLIIFNEFCNQFQLYYINIICTIFIIYEFCSVHYIYSFIYIYVCLMIIFYIYFIYLYIMLNVHLCERRLYTNDYIY